MKETSPAKAQRRKGRRKGRRKKRLISPLRFFFAPLRLCAFAGNFFYVVSENRETGIRRLLQDRPYYPEAPLKLSPASWRPDTNTHRMRRFFAAGYKCLSRCHGYSTTPELCREFVTAPWL